MAIQVTVSNRQRRVRLDGRRLRACLAGLADSVCANLRRQPDRRFPARCLAEMEERGAVSVILVSDRAIRKINRQWRGKDAATDVISFPLAQKAPPAGLPWEMGEIFISAETARRQAEEYGHTLERELAFLFAHGMLHVLGFTHDSPARQRDMFGRQRSILAAAGITR